MAVKTITITVDAYEAIKGLKKEQESFSELFLRMGHKRATLKDLAGLFKHTPEQTRNWKDRIEDLRKQMDEGAKKRLEDVRTRLKRNN